jgi:hypothetical protein
MSDTNASPGSVPIDSHSIDRTTISNAVLFCQDSIAKLAEGKRKLNPLGVSPGVFDMVDSISQLQNSMLDLLNWADQVDKRLAQSPSE